MLMQSRYADQTEFCSAEGRAQGRYRALKLLLSFCLVLAALLCAGRQQGTAFADDAAAYDRIYYFNMDSKGLQGNMMLVETTDANGVPHWGLLDAGHRYAKTIQDDPDNSSKSFSTKVHGLSSQIYCRNGKDVAQYMINVLGVTHLDFIIGTHAHSDHVGGIPELVATTFTDGQGVTRSLVDSTTTYYYKEYQHISNLEDDLVKFTSTSWHNQAFAYQAAKAMEDAGATLVDLSSLNEFSTLPEGLRFVTRGELGDEYGDSVEFTVGGITFRLYNLYEHTDTGGENVNSIVAVMSNGQYTVVNLADIDTDNGAIDKVSAAIAEAYGTVDIVVAGHHGYTGSNTKEMFDQLQPEFVVVSNGSSGSSWFYTTGDLAAAIPYANERYGTDFYSTAISYYATVTDLSGNAVHIYSVNDTGVLMDAMEQMLQANRKKTGWVSWAQTGGTLWSYLEKGQSVKDAWRTVKGKRYHFDKYGIMQTGWTEIDGLDYYLDPKSGAAKSGWRQKDDGSWYYMSASTRSFGRPVTGWQTISKKRYYFNESGVMLTETWVDGCYLSSSGAMAKGWLNTGTEAEPVWYYLNPNSKARSYGRIMTGWQTIGGKKYYFDEDGVMQHDAWQDSFYLTHDGPVATGFQTMKDSAGNDATFYFDPNTKSRSYGRALTGWRTISGKRYLFDDEGRMQTGWVMDHSFYMREEAAKKAPRGSMVTGWLNAGTEADPVWYYLNPNSKARSYGRAVTGWQTIGKKKYCFADDGVMKHDTWEDSFYLTHDGPVATGWLEEGGFWYYLEPNTKSKSYGRALTGWRTIKNRRYLFDDAGHLLTGWYDDSFYLKEDGKGGADLGSMVTGWIEDDGFWYYLNPNTKARNYGRKMYGWQTIGKKKYFFDDYGRMAHDAWQDDYYLNESGTIATGLVTTADGSTYYLNPNTKAKNYGRALTGWQQTGGKWYFFDDSGKMLSGAWTEDGFYLTAEGPMAAGCWQTLDGKRYYFDAKGKTLSGWQMVEGEKYFFNEDGSIAVNTMTEAGWLDENGILTTGLVTASNGGTYYLDADGNRLTGWQTVDGTQYYFDADGALVRNDWASDGRYVGGDGAMVTGWKELPAGSGIWYYFDANGSRHTGWLDDNGARYFFGADGVMLTGEASIDGEAFFFDENGRLTVKTDEGEDDGEPDIAPDGEPGDDLPDSGNSDSGSDSGGNPGGTDPADNVDPTDNSDPVDNTDPTDSTDPTDNVDPADNTDTTDNSDPVDNVDPTDNGDHSDNADPLPDPAPEVPEEALPDSEPENDE